VEVDERLRAAEQAAQATPADRREAWVDTVLIVAGVAGMAVHPHKITSDGRARYDALTQLLSTGTLSDNQYSLIGPLFATPLWLLAKLFGADPATWLKQYNIVLFALGLLATYLLLRDRVDTTLLRRFLLLLTAGSLVATHTVDFYGEMFTMVGVGVGVLAAVVHGPRWVNRAGWVAIMLGAANTPASLPGLGLVGAGQAVQTRRWRYAVAVLAGVLLVGGEAWLRRGSPFDSGYAGTYIAKTVMPYSGVDGFSYPFILGLFAILFSFGKGIVFYLPGIVLPVKGKLRGRYDPQRVDLYRAYVLWLLYTAGLVLVYASWWSWYGGMYFGPRFFLIGILPASLALAAYLTSKTSSLLTNLATLAVLALSVWIGADSAVFDELWAWTCYENNWALESLCHFTPDYSALWYPFVAKPQLNLGQLARLTYYAVVFAWLATPLLARIGQQTGRWLTASVLPRFGRGWRF
jgi:hypothetical protein